MPEMIDPEARRMVSELAALVESEGKATRAAVEAVMAYLREHEREQGIAVKRLREAVDDLDATTAQLVVVQARLLRQVADGDRRDAELATSVARIATTGGATGGLVGAAIAALLSALQGCGPALVPTPTGHHGAPSYVTPSGGSR